MKRNAKALRQQLQALEALAGLEPLDSKEAVRRNGGRASGRKIYPVGSGGVAVRAGSGALLVRGGSGAVMVRRGSGAVAVRIGQGS